MMQMRIDDFEPSQGAGYVPRYFENCFEQWTEPMAHTLDDFAKITAATLIRTGDRDEQISVEEAVSAYCTLPNGELGVIPNMGHAINSLVCIMAVDFLRRHQGD